MMGMSPWLGRLILLQAGKVKASDATLVGSAANSNKLGLYGDAAAMQKFGGPAPDPRAAADKASLPKQIADAAVAAAEAGAAIDPDTRDAAAADPSDA